MGKIREKSQSNFWSGVVNDPRSTLASGFYYSENLEVGKNKSLKQVANNQAENACSYDVNNYITKVIQVGTDIYGLGQDDNTDNDTTLWTKTSSLDGAWAIATNGTIAATTFPAGDALLASVNGMIFLDGGNDYVAKYVIATDAMTDEWKALAGGMKGGTIWQGSIYGWNGQKIYKIDPVADTLTDMKTVSTEQTIVDLVPYGNLLMIVCTSTITNSKAYLWDGVNTTTWVDILDIGYGTVSGGAILEGQIIVAIGSANRKTLKLKSYGGGQFRNLFTYNARPNQSGTAYVIPASKLKAFSGYIYFILTGTKPDGTYAGLYEYSIARFGREEPVNPLTFSIYKTLDFTSDRGLDGQTANNDFTILENIVGEDKPVMAFINSTGYATTEFLGSDIYTGQEGVMETVIYDGGDASIEKHLTGVGAYYTALGTTGQVVMKYKKDEETTWTEIFADTTDDALSHQAVNLEASGLVLPIFKEISFRFLLTGEAELNGYKFKWESLAPTNY